MEILRQTILITLLLLTTHMHAQTQQQLQDAFSNSYTLESEKKYGEAINQLSVVYSESSYEINLRLGWLHYLNTDYSSAATFYQRSINLMPAATEPLWGITQVYAAQNNWIKLEKAYKSIIELDSKNSIAHYWLGMIFYNRKDYTSAKRYLDVSLNLNPFDYDVLLLSAWTNYFLGNTNEAKILFNKTLLNHPNDQSALEGLSLIK